MPAVIHPKNTHRRVWFASDDSTLLEQYFRCDDNGIQALGPPQAAALEDHITGDRIARRGKCGGPSNGRCCNGPGVPTSWMLGIWDGRPWPLRLRLRSPFYLSRAQPGCGCLARLRDWVDEVSSCKDSFDPCAGFWQSMWCVMFGA